MHCATADTWRTEKNILARFIYLVLAWSLINSAKQRDVSDLSLSFSVLDYCKILDRFSSGLKPIWYNRGKQNKFWTPHWHFWFSIFRFLYPHDHGRYYTVIWVIKIVVWNMTTERIAYCYRDILVKSWCCIPSRSYKSWWGWPLHDNTARLYDINNTECAMNRTKKSSCR